MHAMLSRGRTSDGSARSGPRDVALEPVALPRKLIQHRLPATVLRFVAGLRA